MPWCKGWIVIIATLAALPVAYSAELRRVDRPSCRYILEGNIAKGDLDRLRSVEAELGGSICLDSPGGSYAAGLEVAEYLAGRNITTVVDKDERCLSSCAIIFMGGSDFEELFLPRRKMHVDAVLGFHAPFLVLESKRYEPEYVEAAYAAGLDAVARMMKLGHDERGGEGFIPNRVILELLQRGPNQVYLIDTVLKARELQIELFGFPKPRWNARTACNACMNRNLGMHRVEACSRPEEHTFSKIGPDAIQIVFDGFAGEGAWMCAVRLAKAKNGRVEAFIAATISPDDIPLGPKAFSPLDEVDALDPQMRLGWR